MEREFHILRNISMFFVALLLFYLVANCFGLFHFIGILLRALGPILLGSFISFLFEPLIARLKQRGLSRKVSCILVYLSLTGLVAMMIIVGLPILYRQINELIRSIPDLIAYIQSLDFSFLEIFPLDEIISWLVSEGGRYLVAGVGKFFSFLTLFSVGLGASFYLSLDFEHVKDVYYRFAPRRYRREYRIISKKIGHDVFIFLRGMLYDTILFFAMGWLALGLAGFPYALVMALVLALTNLIPYIGPYLGMLPLAVLGFSRSLELGILAIVICSALQYIEANLVSPLIMKNALRLHPVVGIFGIYIFGSLLGVVGMIFSSLIMHCLLIIYQDFLKPIILDVKLEKNGQIVYNCDEIDEKDE